MLDLAIADKFNRAGFVLAPHSTPEGESSVKIVSGSARHVGAATFGGVPATTELN